MRTLAIAVLSLGLLAFPVAASAAPQRASVHKRKGAAAHAPARHVKTKARHGAAGKMAHAARAQSRTRATPRAQHS